MVFQWSDVVAMRRPAVRKTELEILKVIWEQGPGTVREINAPATPPGTRWAYTTALTLCTD